jgi:hypothetical protein
MDSRRTRVASWIFRREHPSRPKAMICCFFSSFKTFAILREAPDPPAAVNVLDVSSENMAAFQVFMYGRFWVFTEVYSCFNVGAGTSGTRANTKSIGAAGVLVGFALLILSLQSSGLFVFKTLAGGCS